jgi:hypothetical protein
MTQMWVPFGPDPGSREECVKDVEHIRSQCKHEHSKETLIECSECWGRALDRIRRYYLSSSPVEWFQTRRPFLDELDSALSAAQKLELDPRKLPSLIEKGKGKWYLESVRDSVIYGLVEDILGREALTEAFENHDLDLVPFAENIRNALEQDPVDREATDLVLDKLKVATEPEERRKILGGAIFAPAPDDNVAEHDRPYYEMLVAGTPLQDAADRILDDSQAAQQARDKEGSHRQRINELQRARTANEVLQKSRKGGGPRPQAPERFYHPANCLACGRARDFRNMIACALCEVFKDRDIKLPSTGAWCSDKCYVDAHGDHLEHSPSHSCVAGDGCVRLTDSDVDMDGAGEEESVCLCRECLDCLQQPSVYCSPRCAEADFPRHRDTVHVPGRQRLGMELDDKGKLRVSEGDPSKYYAKDISEHLIPLAEALKTLGKTAGISIDEVENGRYVD